MYRLPARSNARPAGQENLALVTGPPSPAKPLLRSPCPTPKAWTLPETSSEYTRCATQSEKKSVPSGATAIPSGANDSIRGTEESGTVASDAGGPSDDWSPGDDVPFPPHAARRRSTMPTIRQRRTRRPDRCAWCSPNGDIPRPDPGGPPAARKLDAGVAEVRPVGPQRHEPSLLLDHEARAVRRPRRESAGDHLAQTCAVSVDDIHGLSVVHAEETEGHSTAVERPGDSGHVFHGRQAVDEGPPM